MGFDGSEAGGQMSAVRFLGRTPELSVLAGQVETLRAGVGGATVVHGEQGIGKTALLRAGLSGAQALGCRVLWASAEESRRHFPLRLILDCLGSLVAPEAGRQPGPVFGTDPALAEAERLLAVFDRLCAISPVVLVAEDLQWADEASLRVWIRLSRATGQMPLLLAGSWRSAAGRPDLAALRRAVLARRGHALRLGPLAADDISALVAERVGGRPGRELTELLGRAAGNPLYARELADGLVREGMVRVDAGIAEVKTGGAARIPASLTAVIAARVAALGRTELGVLQKAAVLGTECLVTDLAVVTGLRSWDLRGAIDAAVAAGVAARTGARLAFRHGLIRQVLYEEMPESHRLTLHAQAARGLSDAGAPAERVAAHLVAAWSATDPAVFGPLSPWLPDWLTGNAADLIHRAPRAAADLLRVTLSRLPADDPRRDPLEAVLVAVSFMLARHADTERWGKSLISRSSAADQVAEMTWLVAYTYLRTQRAPAADQLIEQALERPEIGGGARSRLTALHAMIGMSLGEPDTATSRGEQALELARQAGDPIGTGYALHALSVVSFNGRHRVTALDLVDQALAVVGDDPQAADLRSMLLTNKTAVLELIDQPAAALATARQALILAESAGTHRIAAARFTLAEQHFLFGDWDDALAELEVAVGQPGQDYLPAMVHAMGALIAGHRDDRETMARELARTDVSAAGSALARHAEYSLLASALAAEQAGNTGQAARLLAPCLEPANAERLSARYLLLPTLARLAVTTGDYDLGAATVLAARAEADRDPIAVIQATASHCHGLAVAAGDPDMIASAAAYFRAAGRPLEHALALEDAAALWAARGDLERARVTLAEALAVHYQLGALWQARRAGARLRALGVRGPRHNYRARPATGWEALTHTEKRVARLVAQGGTNLDIAAALFLSRYTVQTHVSHILAKLGGRSRADITREALRDSWQALHPHDSSREAVSVAIA